MDIFEQDNNVMRIMKGDVLYRQGESCDTMYVLGKGRIGLYLGYGTPKEYLLIELSEPGSSLGEMGLLEGEPRNATAVALEDSILSELTEDNILEFITDHPSMGMKMIKDLAHRFTSVAKELESAKEIVRDVVEELEVGGAKKSLRERVRKLAAALTEIPEDVPPDLYMTVYMRNQGHFH